MGVYMYYIRGCVRVYVHTHKKPLSCWLFSAAEVFAAGGSGGLPAHHTCCASVTEATYNYITN